MRKYLKGLVIVALACVGSFDCRLARADAQAFDYGNVTVHFADDPNERNPTFNADAKRNDLPGTIVRCRTLLTMHFGGADGDNVYGGLCTFAHGNTKASVEVCDDDMVGHFRVYRIASKARVSKEEIAEFMQNSCVGG